MTSLTLSSYSLVKKQWCLEKIFRGPKTEEMVVHHDRWNHWPRCFTSPYIYTLCHVTLQSVSQKAVCTFLPLEFGHGSVQWDVSRQDSSRHLICAYTLDLPSFVLLSIPRGKHVRASLLVWGKGETSSAEPPSCLQPHSEKQRCSSHSGLRKTCLTSWVQPRWDNAQLTYWLLRF